MLKYKTISLNIVAMTSKEANSPYAAEVRLLIVGTALVILLRQILTSNCFKLRKTIKMGTVATIHILLQVDGPAVFPPYPIKCDQLQNTTRLKPEKASSSDS